MKKDNINKEEVKENQKKPDNPNNLNTEMKFLQKVRYSIININKYEEMQKEGIKKALKYFSTLVAMLAIIIAIIVTIKLNSTHSKGIKSLEENIKDIKLSNYELTTEESVILDNQEVKDLFSGIFIIIDTEVTTEDVEQKYSSYIESDNQGIILLKNEIYTINLDGIENQTYKYNEILTKYVEEGKEYNKQDLIDYLNSTPIFYYTLEYFIAYFAYFYIILVFAIILFGIIFFITNKIMKLKYRLKEIISLIIYSTTVSMILLAIAFTISLIAELNIKYLDIISFIPTYVYMILIMKNRKKHY